MAIFKKARPWLKPALVLAGLLGGGVALAAQPFSQQTTVTVVRSGSGQGSVLAAGSPMSCNGNVCTRSFTVGQSVTLNATPAAGSTFGGWSGVAGCGPNPVCTTSASPGLTATATFLGASAAQTLTINRAGAGGGSVQGNFGAPCNGTTCAYAIPMGQSIQLTAVPAAGHAFAGWSGACSGTGPCTVSMTQARTVTAAFNPPQTSTRSATVTTNGPGSVTITLTAQPQPGRTFVGWSGACTGTAPTCTVPAGQAQSATATFQ